MKHSSIIVCSIGLMIPALAGIENASPAHAADVPAYLKPIVGTETSSAAEIGTKNVLQLKRVRHPQQRCRTKSERATFSVRGELDPQEP